MTSKEELKKEAEDWIGGYTSVPCSCMFLKYDYINLVEAYIASAEPREKRIAEQEKLLNSTLDENKEIYKKMADLDTALEDCTESLTDARIKIKELEKELKSEKEYSATLRKEIDEYTNSHTLCAKYKELKQQLAKAKELIKQLCLMVRELNNPNVQLTNVDYSLKEAEQFLKEYE